MSTVLDAALAYAARGWPVFPCDPTPEPPEGSGEEKVSKRPLTRNGLKDASTDPTQIRRWWREYPDALIGLPTGQRLGAFVVDLDPRDKPCAQLWEDLETLIGEPLGDPIVAWTQSGGWHLFFAWPEGMGGKAQGGEYIGNRAGTKSKLPKNVDVRGDGGYVIAAPSVMRDGKSYRWRGRQDGERALTTPPATLVDAILRRGRFAERVSERASRAAIPAATATSERVRKYALSALEAETRELAGVPQGGGRNEALNTAAYSLGQLVGAGALSDSVVRATLDDVAVGWGRDIRKSRATIESGLRAGMAKPRDLAELERASGHGGGAPPHPHPPTRHAEPSKGRAASPGGGSGDGGGGGGGRSTGGAGGVDPERLRRCSELELNDTGNGHRLLEWYGDDVLHVRDVGWAVWDGRRWSLEGGGEAVSRYAQETARRIHREVVILKATPADEEAHDGDVDAIEKTVKKRRSQRHDFARSAGNTSRLTGMIGVAATHATIAVDQLDAEALALNLANGTLRVVKVLDPECPDPDVDRYIHSVRLDPHRPADRISKLMNARYDPDATCPRWEAFVERFVPDRAVRWWLQRWHGYCLTGLTDAQLLAFNHGAGANGKSTFCEAIRQLMGDYAAALPAEAVTGEQSRRSDQATPELARLTGVRLVLIGELPKNQPLKEETIKLITGGEVMLVRHLNQGFFDLRPTFKPVMTGNFKPNATGSDYAIWRRLRLVPWTEKIAEREKRPMAALLREFDAEAAGILNWLLRGLTGYLDEGMGAPAAIADATEEYRAEMDPVGEFVKACVKPMPANEIDARSLYGAYTSWCDANAMKPFSEVRFEKEMRQTGIRKSKGRIRKYLDIVLSDVPGAVG